RSMYNALPFSIDSGLDGTGFGVLSASAGSSQVFLEKSCGALGAIDLLSFWLRLVAELFAFCVELFAFCAEVNPIFNELVNRSVATRNKANADRRSMIDIMSLLLLVRPLLANWAPCWRLLSRLYRCRRCGHQLLWRIGEEISDRFLWN